MGDWQQRANDRRDFRATHDGPEEPRRRMTRKNTKRWCKGVVGREHQAETVLGKNDYFGRGCTATDWAFLGERWCCYHVVQCANCGKILCEWLGQDCPDYPRESPGQSTQTGSDHS